ASLESLALMRASAAGSTKPLAMLVVSLACCTVWAEVGTRGCTTTGWVATGAWPICWVPVLEQPASARAKSGMARSVERFIWFVALFVDPVGSLVAYYGESASASGRRARPSLPCRRQ